MKIECPYCGGIIDSDEIFIEDTDEEITVTCPDCSNDFILRTETE